MDAIILPAADSTTCHPLTVHRSISEVPVANTTLLKAQIAALATAGFEHVHRADGDDIDPHTAPDGRSRLALVSNVWLAPVDLRRLRRGEVTTLIDPTDESTVASVSGVAEADLVVAHMSDESFRLHYPWEFLRLNALLLADIETDIQGELHPAAHVDGVLQLGAGSRVLPGVYIEGNVVIGKNCKIGPNCYLRGPTCIGDDCHVGQAVEIKASIIMSNSSVAHLSYFGDSIVGEHSNVGAGSITANLRHDGSNNRSFVGDSLVDTGRRKLGAIIGDHVHLGINTSLYPGRKIWPHGITVPGQLVNHDIVTDPREYE